LEALYLVAQLLLQLFDHRAPQRQIQRRYKKVERPAFRAGRYALVQGKPRA